MKFKIKIKYDSRENRLYVNRLSIVVLCGLGILAVIFAAVWVLWQTNALKVLSPDDENRPLGVAPALNGAGSADQAVLDELKKTYGNKFTIIFFYDGFKDQQDALGKIEVLKAALFSVEPFKSLKDLVAFKIFTTEGQACRVIEGDRKTLACDSRMLEGLSRLGIDHLKAVVLSPQEFNSSSQLSRGKNSPIIISTDPGKLNAADAKRWLGIVFMQELGHSLGLRYEYFTGKPGKFNDQDTAGLPNCADSKEAAKEWWGTNGVYFKGCAGKDSNLYPIQNTLMSDDPKIEGYGKISEDYLRGAISCFYAGKEAFTTEGKEKSCTEFKKDYPKFWEE